MTTTTTPGKFYRLRYSLSPYAPQKVMMVYAHSESEARDKAERKLSADYECFELHRQLQVFDCERVADNNCPNGLFGSMTKADIDEWLSEREPLPETPKEEPPPRLRKLGDPLPKKPKKPRLSQLESMIQAYQTRQRIEAQRIAH